MFKNKKGFSFIELIVIIAVLAVLAALIAPSLLQYTERSRAQKDVSSMDEVVNAVQLAMANSDCYDEAIKYSCSNNFITYTDSSGKYSQQELDGEYWAPDGSGKATTITFNPETDVNGNTVYKLENGIVNDMTYGNGSVAQDRVMEGAQIENNQCYLKNMTYLYNLIRQSIGNDVITTSATYKNSSFTIFIKFSQKDGVKDADVHGAFNGTNLTPDSQASKGSGTSGYYGTDYKPIISINGGKTQSVFTNSDLHGTGSFSGIIVDYKQDKAEDYRGGVYYIGVTNPNVGEYESATDVYKIDEDGFPNQVSTGDVFVLGDYEYRYNYSFNESKWVEKSSQNGWGVRCISEVKAPGRIVKSINGINVVSMEDAFYKNNKLGIAPEIPTGVINMQSTFNSCSNLKTIPTIPNSVKNMTRTFRNCISLTGEIKVNANLSTYTQCFLGTVKQITLTGTSSQLKKLAATDGFEDLSEYDNVRVVSSPAVAIFYDSGTLVFQNFAEENSDYGNIVSIYYGDQSWIWKKYNIDDLPPWSEHAASIKAVIANCNQELTNTSFWFYGLKNCKTMDLTNLNTTHATSMQRMFDGCSNLEQISLKGWNTSNVTDMSEMFNGCSKLTSIDMSSFNTSKVKWMEKMFSDCTSLKTLNLSHFNTENVIYTQRMFKGCTSLQHLNISNFYTPKLESMAEMFAGCQSLTELNISQIDTSKVTTMIDCFYGMSKIQKVTFGDNWKWVGNNKNLPLPSTSFVPNVSGKWYNNSTGASYLPTEIPNGAGTYVAIKPDFVIELKTFEIVPHGTFQFRVGMTWAEWAKSSYNTIGLVISGDYLELGDEGRLKDMSYNDISAKETITEKHYAITWEFPR